MSDLHYKVELQKALEIARNGVDSPSGLIEVTESKLREFEDLVAELDPDEVALIVSNMGVNLQQSAHNAAAMFQDDIEIDDASDDQDIFCSGVVTAHMDSGSYYSALPIDGNDNNAPAYDIEGIAVEVLRASSTFYFACQSFVAHYKDFISDCEDQISEIIDSNELYSDVSKLNHHGTHVCSVIGNGQKAREPVNSDEYWNLDFSRHTIKSAGERKSDWSELAFGDMQSESAWSPVPDQHMYMHSKQNTFFPQVCTEAHINSTAQPRRKGSGKTKLKKK